MKLIIQIPCYNEELTLPQTLKSLPKQIDKISNIEYLVIDDGSNDDTIAVAKKFGVHHIVKHKKNFGLARAFQSGLKKSLALNADIIVNTDADNQYCGEDISKLVKPVVDKAADIVVGSRPILKHKEFSISKKILQILGSKVVSFFSGINIADAPSGFRAYSRDAAKKINIFSNYTYTLESLIQASQSGLVIHSVPIRVNPKTRESRLLKNNFDYIKKSISTMIRSFAIYRPFKFFGILGLIFLLVGFIPLIRFLYLYFFETAVGHIQSLVVGGIFIVMGLILFIFSFISEIISINRKLLEKILNEISK